MNCSASQVLVAVFVAVGLLLAPASLVHAQNNGPGTSAVGSTKHPIPADGKGIVGVGLIGAELGFVLPAVAGVHATWAYIVFPIVGAAGGATAGYFGLEKGGHTDLAVASLAVGMGLLIPALVITASATAYDPEDDEAAAGAKRRQAQLDVRDPRNAGSGMLRVAENGIALSAPALDLVPASAAPGKLTLAGAEVSLLSGRF
jgi:hypothetical protein